MEAKWVPAVYYTQGRDSKVRRIVLHWMATTLAGCDATFTGGGRQASAHYGIENTTVHQYVKESDTAWHAGVRSVNHESIGIEHSAQPGRDATEATVQTSIALCTELCRRHGLTADAIFVHNDFYATQCPGTLPVSRIREAVRKNLAGAPAVTKEWDEMASKEEIQRAILWADVIPSKNILGDANPTVTTITALRWACEWSLAARNAAQQSLSIVKAMAAKGGALTEEEIEAAAKRGAAEAIGEVIENATVELNVKES